MANPPSRLAIAAPHDPPAGVGQIDLHPATRAALNVLSLGAYQHPAAAGDYWKAQAQAYNPLHPAGAVNAATLFMGKLTPAQEGFLNAIHETSRGNAVGLGEYQPEIEDLGSHVGTPLGLSGNSNLGGTMAYNPFELGTTFPRWLSTTSPLERTGMSGQAPGMNVPGYSMRPVDRFAQQLANDPSTLESIFAEHNVPEFQQALINYLRNVGSHAGGIKPGTEGN